MEKNNNSQLNEKRKFLFFLKLNAHARTLANRSLIAKMRKEIARQAGSLNSKA